MSWIKMDKTRKALEYNIELMKGEMSIFFSPMIGWFEFIEITILCLSHKTFVMYKV
jgi:hypothetical protein